MEVEYKLLTFDGEYVGTAFGVIPLPNLPDDVVICGSRVFKKIEIDGDAYWKETLPLVVELIE